jgi:transcriptional regulator with XRE-family HTH domain
LNSKKQGRPEGLPEFTCTHKGEKFMKTKLQILREKAGLSQRELADLAGVNFRMLQAYDNGGKNFSTASALTVLKIADALNCDAHEIIDIEPVEDKEKLRLEKKRIHKRINQINNFLEHGIWFE